MEAKTWEQGRIKTLKKATVGVAWNIASNFQATHLAAFSRQKLSLPEVLVSLFESPYFHPSFCTLPYETHKNWGGAYSFCYDPEQELARSYCLFYTHTLKTGHTSNWTIYSQSKRMISWAHFKSIHNNIFYLRFPPPGRQPFLLHHCKHYTGYIIICTHCSYIHAGHPLQFRGVFVWYLADGYAQSVCLLWSGPGILLQQDSGPANTETPHPSL